MGCAVCVKTCPVNALEMKSLESQREQNEVWSYLMDNVTPKKELQSAMNVKGSQFMVPYLEFSGSCAGCAETSYARLITQLYGDRMIISNATGCSSIWGGPLQQVPTPLTAKERALLGSTPSLKTTQSTASALPWLSRSAVKI